MKTKFLKTNLFKIIATVVVIVFALIIIGGIIKFYHYKSSFVKGDESQINAAKEIALAALQAQGKNSSDYEIRVMPQFRRIPKDNENNNSMNLMEVSLFNAKETQLFLINIDTKEILMRTETDYYNTDYFKPELKEGCKNRKDDPTERNKHCLPSPEKGRWFHEIFVK